MSARTIKQAPVVHSDVAPSDVPHDRSGQPTLEIVGFDKAYGPNAVLKGMSLVLHPGEIVGLLGANGAGKSTLIKAIVGAIGVDGGSMRVSGTDVDLRSYDTRAAGALGVHCVYQDPSICTNLSVYENFSLIQRRQERRWRANSREAARAALDDVFPEPGFSVGDELSQLSLAEAHMVEIAAAATQEHIKVLILDEPSSALSFRRTNELHNHLRRLAERGVAIVYVSHKIEEIQALTDRLIVLRDGVCVWEGRSKDTAVDEIIVALGGQKLIEAAEQEGRDGLAQTVDEGRSVEPVLSLNGLTTRTLTDVDLSVRPGEIVGLAGLEGSGQREVLHEVFKPTKAARRSVDKRVRCAYVTGDRETEGTFRLWDIGSNITIASARRLSRHGVIDRGATAEMANRWSDRLKIDAPSPATSIVSLSGGNQQKALIARGLGTDAELLLLDDPTRGVDIGTKQEIYAQLGELRAAGRSALLYSTENTEFKLCDRVYVFRNGRVIGELAGSENTAENIVGLSFQQMSRGDKRVEPRSETSAASPSTRSAVLWRSRTTLPIALLIVALAVNGLLNSASLSPSGLSALIGGALPLLFAAVAAMLIIVAGDIDLGVGAAVGLANVISATQLVTHPAIGLLMLAGLPLAYAALGWLVEALRMPSIVVTLGASFVWLGIALSLQPQPGGSSPSWLANALTVDLPYVPESVYIAVALAVLGACFLRLSRRGIVWRALGNKPRAVYQAGLSTVRTRVGIYATAGALIVISGLISTGLNQGSDANGSASYTLLAIAAVIVGGAEFAGGFVTTVGVVAAAAAFALIPSILVFLNVGTAYESVITGAILVGTLAVRRFAPKGRLA